MKVRIGKRTMEVSRDELLARIAGHSQVLMDIGTGDARFAYQWAKSHPDTFCIGVDAVGERMREISHRATRKPMRGGRPNLLLAVAAVDALPAELAGLADIVTVNFPWGSLLRALVEPSPKILAGLRAVARDGAELLVLFNLAVFQNRPYAERLALPILDPRRVEEVLAPIYRTAGFEVTGFRTVSAEELPHRTTWGQHLVLGSARTVALLSGRALPGSLPV